MSPRNDRIRTLTTRSRFRVGAVLVHPDRLTIERDGQEIALEPRVMEVLVALSEHAGEVVSAEQLLIEVWHGKFYGDNPVHRAIGQLRRQLGDDPRKPVFLDTVRKRGYRLIASVAFPDDYSRHPLQSEGWAGRSPFVGLRAFGSTHTEVFFGRTRLTAEVLSALRRQREVARRFVLLVGASGCGKTSLLRASVLPLLEQAGGFDGLHALSVAHCDLAAESADDPIRSVVAALAAWTIEGRPVIAPQSLPALTEAVGDRPELVAEALGEAFRRRPSRSGDEHAHLLLVVDHAEALVAANRHDTEQNQRLWRVLDAICAHPCGGVLMAVRSDFYADLLAALPGIVERKRGHGHIDALAPRPGEIGQIVRMPAFLAGLSFEEDPSTAARLDDVLRDAAAGQPDALPLLQHTLQALYERRAENGTLTFDGYHAIGGLEGALAHRAEEVFSALPAAVRECLGTVLTQLIVMQPESESLSARRVPRASLPDPAAQVLVEHFIRARLFVGDQNDGASDFGVAHEALLRQWPRARDWAQDNRRLLQARSRLQRAATRWEEAGRREDHLLNPGQPLDEAIEVAQRLPQRLAPAESALLDASLRLRRRSRRGRQLALTTLIALSLCTSGLALWASTAQHEAEHRRAAALQLSDYLLVDLADKLRPLGNLKLLGDISRQMLAVVDRDDARRMQPADLVNRSRALRTLGEALMEQAKLDDAQRLFVAADTAARAARARLPRSTDALAEAGIASYWLGYLHYRRGDYAQTDQHWREYLEATGALLQQAPEQPQWLVERSYALNNLGTLARRLGRSEEATARFRASAELKQRALLSRPDDATLRFDLIDTLSWVSSAEQAQGLLERAANGNATQISMLRELIETHPNALAWQRRLATSLRRSAALALDRGRIDEARAMLDESTAVLADLLPKAPDNLIWRRDFAHALLDRAELARIEGDNPASLALLRRADALSASLRTEPVPAAETQRMDAVIRARLAALQQQPDEVSRALNELRRLVDDAPEDVFGRAALAHQHIARGRRYLALGEQAAAQSDLAQARGLLAALGPDSQDPAVLAPWIQAHVLAGLSTPVEADRLVRAGYDHPEHPTHLSAMPIPAQHPPAAAASPDPLGDQPRLGTTTHQHRNAS